MSQPEDIEAGLDEVARARAEDPEFPERQARALAKARNEPYDPARHGPFGVTIRKRAAVAAPPKNPEPIDTTSMLERFQKRGPAQLEISELAQKRADIESRRKDLNG